MHILLTGGTGLIGTELVSSFNRDGHRVTILTRANRESSRQVKFIRSLRGYTERCDIVINLAGAGLAGRRWSEAYKMEIRNSRLATTEILVDWIRSSANPPKRLISASAIGYYGASDDAIFTETDPSGKGFSATLCKDWEMAACQAESMETEVVRLRLGVVLSRQGGAYPELTKSYGLGVGSWLGSGRQWLSWVHLEDVCNIFAHVIAASHPRKVYNAVAPEAVRHKDFSRAVSQTRFTLFSTPVPAPAVRLLAGEMADELLLNGQRVVPANLLKEAFTFRYPTAESAIDAMLT